MLFLPLRLAPLLTLLVLSQPAAQTAKTDTDEFEATSPCADSTSTFSEGAGDFGGLRETSGMWGSFQAYDEEECDPETSALFGDGENREDREDRDAAASRRGARFASYTVAGSTGEGALAKTHSIIRHRDVSERWSHNLEVRGDSLVRRRIAWRGDGWRLALGDMTDTALRAAPRGLPQRAMPAGWSAARGTPEAPEPFAASVLQGFAAGVAHPEWSAYAMRTWNPVANVADAAEPPWNPAWSLNHTVAGATVALPWIFAVHVSETSITRRANRKEEFDTSHVFNTTTERALSERRLATEFSSPRRGMGLLVALGEDDRARTRGALIGADLRPRLSMPDGSRMSFDLTARQRTAGWSSAWDPALSASVLEQRFAQAEVADALDASDDSSEDEEQEEEEDAWGAGEVRAAGRWKRATRHATRDAEDHEGLSFEGIFGFDRVSGEAWRAWNPDAGTARQGMRGGVGWSQDGLSIDLSGTYRTARAASGSVSVYRFVRADTRMADFPRARAAAWRAWNRAGPTRTGLFFGADPTWDLTATEARPPLTSLALSPGLRVELGPEDAASAQASLELSLRTGFGWSVDAAGAVPFGSANRNTGGSWRVMMSTHR